jgi:hypothetical protein
VIAVVAKMSMVCGNVLKIYIFIWCWLYCKFANAFIGNWWLETNSCWVIRNCIKNSKTISKKIKIHPNNLVFLFQTTYLTLKNNVIPNKVYNSFMFFMHVLFNIRLVTSSFVGSFFRSKTFSQIWTTCKFALS